MSAAADEVRHRTHTKTIRAAARVLDVLVAVNRHEAGTLTELAATTGLSAATTLRLLRTLQANGFIARDQADDRYRPTAKVRQLSSGHNDEAWITDCVRPHLVLLGRKLKWPVSLAIPSGIRMLIRENTDASSPLAIRRYTTGLTLPMLRSASGLAYLASCNPVQRDMLLEILASAEDADDAMVGDPIEIRRMLDEIGQRGYAFHHVPRRVSDLTTLAVPILSVQRMFGCITVRFARSAVGEREATRDFLPALRETAKSVTRDLCVFYGSV